MHTAEKFIGNGKQTTKLPEYTMKGIRQNIKKPFKNVKRRFKLLFIIFKNNPKK